MMNKFVGLDVSQKMTAICVVDSAVRRVWLGQRPTAPEQIAAMVPPTCAG
jgi:transposase